MNEPAKRRASLAPTKSVRPRPRPERPIDLTPNAEAGDQVFIGKKPPVQQKRQTAKKKAGGTMKYATGGMCRGMGAATKGGKYSRGM
jgi:hypothetical protein